MKIGLTYDLRSEYLALGYSHEATAELDSEATVSALDRTLQALGHQTDRIGHLRQLTTRLAAGDRWDLVFNICEGMHGLSRESQVPALLEGWQIPCTFSDSFTMAVCLHKGLTKAILERAGLATAAFCVVESAADIPKVQMPWPLFVKPVAEGTGKGVSAASVVRSAAELDVACRSLLDRFHQPVLVERFLPGREFTVGILGTGPAARVIGTMEVELLPNAEQGCYSLENKEHWQDRVRYTLVQPDQDPEAAAAAELALQSWLVLNGRDAGRIDIRSDEHGRPAFIEANPLAGLNPDYSDLPMLATKAGLTYQQLIGGIVDSAALRIRPTP
ncbi:MAG TPA: D-alanine--D-alanine ligase [Planctomycetaceae bacterium]|nr:D-alanine--D-alanine ligase [Planctomycetaceae bacterium]